MTSCSNKEEATPSIFNFQLRKKPYTYYITLHFNVSSSTSTWLLQEQIRFTIKFSENLLKGLTFIDIDTGNYGERISEVLISYKMRKVLNYKNFEFIPLFLSFTDQSVQSNYRREEGSYWRLFTLVFINFKVKAFLYLGLFSHCLENWTKYNPAKRHQLNNSRQNSSVKRKLFEIKKMFTKNSSEDH